MTAPGRETILPTIISRYDSRDIYNADELGLFYKALPTKSMHLKDEKCSGGKNSKIRLTGLAAVNMYGEKIPRFVIGRSKKLRCFKGVKSTPCRYCAQKIVRWTPNYLKNGSENRTESLHYSVVR